MYKDSQTWQYSLSKWRNLEESKEEIIKEKIKNNGDSQKGFFKKFIDELKKVLTIGDNFMRWYTECFLIKGIVTLFN